MSALQESTSLSDEHYDDDDEDYLLKCDDDLFEEYETGDEKKKHMARLDRRRACVSLVEEAEKEGPDPHTSAYVLVSSGDRVVWSQIRGCQQGVAWECSLRLCRALEVKWNEVLASQAVPPSSHDQASPRDQTDAPPFSNVLELGCGLGLPGLVAAKLGAREVTVTDTPGALGPARAAISLNGLGGIVSARPLTWGDHADMAQLMLPTLRVPIKDAAPQEGHQGASPCSSPCASPCSSPCASTSARRSTPFDLVLCSDLIYGDEAPSRLLVDTLLEVCSSRTLVLSLHERRLHGDQGRSFFSALDRTGVFEYTTRSAAPNNFTGAQAAPWKPANNAGEKRSPTAREDEFFALTEIRRRK